MIEKQEIKDKSLSLPLLREHIRLLSRLGRRGQPKSALIRSFVIVGLELREQEPIYFEKWKNANQEMVSALHTSQMKGKTVWMRVTKNLYEQILEIDKEKTGPENLRTLLIFTLNELGFL